MKRQRVTAPHPDEGTSHLPDCEKKGFQGEEPEDRHFYNGSKKCKPCSRLLWFEPESVPKNFAATCQLPIAYRLYKGTCLNLEREGLKCTKNPPTQRNLCVGGPMGLL